MSQTAYRQWLILKEIPRYPDFITTRELEYRLNNEGCDAKRRTIQRDLDTLSSHFPLCNDETMRPHRWYWQRDAEIQNFGGIDPPTALTLKLVQAFLKPLLPETTLKYMKPYFDLAEKVFKKISDNPLRNWPNKIAVIERGIKLNKPVINQEVQKNVYEALMREKQIDAKYRKRDAKTSEQYRIYPLGIVCQHYVIYLVCTIKDRDNIRHLPLHRFESVSISDAPDPFLEIPENFDLKEYIYKSKSFQYVLQPEPVRLKLLLKARAAVRLYETPIADDQTIIRQEDGRQLLEATVIHTMALTWWLQELGADAEIVAPVYLRNDYIKMVKELNETYQISMI